MAEYVMCKRVQGQTLHLHLGARAKLKQEFAPGTER